MRLVAYTRCSTQEQATTQLGLLAQRGTISVAANANGHELVGWYEDAAASGATLERRPELARAIAEVESGAADGLICAKLDRLSRSIADFTALVARAQRRGWALVVHDVGLDLSTPNGKFVAHILCAVAELERDLIRQRTREALAAAQARGTHVGRPREASDELVARIVDLHENAGESFSAIARMFDSEGVPTVRGGKTWAPSTVGRLFRAEQRRAVA